MANLGLIVHTQNYENYAFHENGELNTDNPYWKAKGGDEILVTVLSHEQVIELGTDKLSQMASDSLPESSMAYEYNLLDWELVELNGELVKTVKKLIDQSTDLGYTKYEFGNDATWDWAVKQLPKKYQELKYY